MPLKNDWANGDLFTPAAANDMANVVNAYGPPTATGQSVVTAANATAARTAISAVGTRSKVRNDPRLRPDGLIDDGDALDAGSVLNVSGASKIEYVSGRLAHDAAAVSGTPTAGYMQVETDSAVRTMRAEVAWPLNAIGAVAYVIPSSVAVWDYDTGGGTLPAAGVHLTAYGNGIWNIAVWNPSAGSIGHVDHSIQPGTATSFTLTVTTMTPSSTQTTSSISANSSAATVQAALVALSNVGPSDVTVTKSVSGNYGVTWATGLGAVTMTATGSGGTMGMAAPLLLSPGNTIDAVVAYSAGLTFYGTNTTVGRYATVWDNSLRWLEMFVYPDTDQVLVVFPDGTNSGLMKHPAIGLFTSNRAVFELFENNSGAVDTPATMGAFAVDDQPTFIDSPVIDKSVLLTTVAQSRPITLYDAGNTTTASITASGSIPVGTAYIELVLIGGGGGGGAGGCQPSGTAANGGSAGGSGGIIREIIPVSALGTTWNISLGRAGLGGASISATGTGTPGAAGLLSSFISGSAVFQALGAGGGAGGTSGGTAAAAGGAGGPFATAGSPSGINGAAGVNGGGMTASLGIPGSASGGGVTTTPTASNGGIGGSNLVRGYTGGTAGIVGGASPGRGTDSTATAITSTPAGTPGPGAGGGAGSASGAAQAGANAAGWGGGGGGGGASLNGSASGKGGDGRGGYVLVKAHLF